MQDLQNSPEAKAFGFGLLGGVALLTVFVVLFLVLGMSFGLYKVHGIP